MKQKIKTLKDLEQQQEKLQVLMKVTAQEFSRSIGTNKKELKGFALKSVGIPLGILGIGKLAVDQFSNRNDENSVSSQSKTQGFIGSILKLLPIILGLIKSKEIIKENSSQ